VPTTSELQAALADILPVPSYTRDANTATRSAHGLQQRMGSAARLALLRDPEAVFYWAQLLCQQWMADATSVLSTLSQLSDDLEALSPASLTEMSGEEYLDDAVEAITSVSARIAAGGTYRGERARIQSALTSFATEGILPAEAGAEHRERVTRLTDAAVGVPQAWAALVEGRARIVGLLDTYLASDRATAPARETVRAALYKLTGLRTLLGASAKDQASQVSSALADVAAVHAAMSSIGDAPSPVGTVVVGPASDGATARDYLLFEGSCRTGPTAPRLSGDNGLIDVAVLGVGTGTEVDRDLHAASIVASAGDYLVLVDEGTVHEVVSNTGTVAVLSPPPRSGLVSARFLTTADRPGTRFKETGTVFGTAYSDGVASDEVLISGTAGAFRRQILVSGTAARSDRCKGTAGKTAQTVFTSATGTYASNTLTDSFASYITDGVEAGMVVLGSSGTATVDSVDSQTQLTVTPDGLFVVDSYTIVQENYDSIMTDDDATFVSDGVEAGDEFYVDGTEYSVLEVISQTQVRLDDTFTADTGLSWWTRAGPNYIYLEVDADTLGASDGDFIIVSGFTYTIESINGSSVETTADITGTHVSSTWSIELDGDTTRFVQSDGETLATLPDGAELVIEGTTYPLAARVSDSEYTLASAVAYSLGPLTWSIRSGSETDTLVDSTNSPFGSVAAGDDVFIEGVHHTVVSKTDATTIHVAPLLPVGGTGISYTLADVPPGWVLEFGDRRARVVSVEAAALVVEPPFPLGSIGSWSLSPPGGGALTTQLVRGSGFPADLVGQVVQVMGRSVRVVARLDPDDDGTFEVLELSEPVPSGKDVMVQVLGRTLGEASVLSTSESLAGVTEGDVLTLWGVDGTWDIDDSGETGGDLPADLTDVDFVICRGGGKGWGRYLLLVEQFSEMGTDVDALSGQIAAAIRGSTAAAAATVTSLSADVQAALDVVSEYRLPRNRTLERVAEMLADTGSSTGIEALRTGDVDALEVSDHAYTAGVGIREIGRRLNSVRVSVDGDIALPAEAAVQVSESLRKAVAMLQASSTVDSVIATTATERVAQALYALTGEASGMAGDDLDTLPWKSSGGTSVQRVNSQADAAIAAIDYVIQNADAFEEGA
jgi:hypothetical protein